MLSDPPPPPSLPPPLFPLEREPTAITTASTSTSDNRYASYNPSILIIAAIIAAAIVAAASIHLLLRVLSRSRSSSSFIHLLPSSTSTSNSSSSQSSPLNQDPNPIINSLPLFSLSSSVARPSSLSSLDCAVCLSPFELSDQLRLLPSCRHAFHSHCIDTWLKSNLSCPLCRSPITTVTAAADPPRSESFRVEIGSVSRRTDPSQQQPTSRSYSLGSSFDYVVDDEIEAVISRVTRSKSSDPQQDSLPPPGEAAAEIAGRGTRSWLKEYVDRLASSASSSFSSIRFSRRSSHRGAGQSSAGMVTGGESYDLERDLHLHLEEEDGGFTAFYRWLVGV